MDLLVAGAGPAYPDRPGTVGARVRLRGGRARICFDLGQGAFAGSPAGGAEHDSTACSSVTSTRTTSSTSSRSATTCGTSSTRRGASASSVRGVGRVSWTISTPSRVLPQSARRSRCRSPGPSRGRSLHVEARRVTHTTTASPPGSRSWVPRKRRAGDRLLAATAAAGRRPCAPLLRPGDLLLSEVAVRDGPGPGAGTCTWTESRGPSRGRDRPITRPSHAPPDKSRPGCHDRGRAGRVSRPRCAGARRGSGDDHGLSAPSSSGRCFHSSCVTAAGIG